MNRRSLAVVITAAARDELIEEDAMYVSDKDDPDAEKIATTGAIAAAVGAGGAF